MTDVALSNPPLGRYTTDTTDKGALLYLYSKFNVRKMLDIGCGSGGQVAEARSMGIAAKGIDTGESTGADINHDFVRNPLLLNRAYDLGWCVEFLQHIDEGSLPNLVPVFRRCRMLVVTHALPSRKGGKCVNAQTTEYWLDKFDSWGFSINTDATIQLKSRSTMVRGFIQDTGMVFLRRRLM